ncbi:hypothetical protein CC78DRAFT_577421 [Lojkania enalia]|uniref:Uncharacterized protein n=1 Tax=Lojkania enalia TaxID=147567 RepID=A0A9P4KIH7_9PLEO|nr:hypothetical protein CC78DRAFT_577421 [Didymosphaeria enalia]
MAQVESHVGNEVNSQVIHDNTMGGRIITGLDTFIARGPTSGSRQRYDINITQSKKEHTGGDGPMRRRPTAKA